ncbi:hypothetical protein ACK12G_20815 [Mycolicibacterium wolinskyi]|uniref:hypothetical protein n=1 Tax=Mycolicibacterium wolinskyi TaxID=59750 RepID=UPI0039179AF7
MTAERDADDETDKETDDFDCGEDDADDETDDETDDGEEAPRPMRAAVDRIYRGESVSCPGCGQPAICAHGRYYHDSDRLSCASALIPTKAGAPL